MAEVKMRTVPNTRHVNSLPDFILLALYSSTTIKFEDIDKLATNIVKMSEMAKKDRKMELPRVLDYPVNEVDVIYTIEDLDFNGYVILELKNDTRPDNSISITEKGKEYIAKKFNSLSEHAMQWIDLGVFSSKRKSVLSSVDKRILKALLSSDGPTSSIALSRDLELPLSVIQRRRRKLGSIFIEKNVELIAEPIGWKRNELFVQAKGEVDVRVLPALTKLHLKIISVSQIDSNDLGNFKIDVIYRDDADLVEFVKNAKYISDLKITAQIGVKKKLVKNDKAFEELIEEL